jgi:lipoprotein-anchoring transpeptidase ErfK/SrfK
MTVLKCYPLMPRFLRLVLSAFAASFVLNYTQLFSLSAAIAQTNSPEKLISSNIATLKRSRQRWIEIKLSTQRLTAWEGKTPVWAVIISTGKAETPTLTGMYAIQVKYRQTRMQGDDYDIPDVPFTMYYSGGYGIHGAYWHKKFGTPVSHGCVNLAVDQAEKLFNWASVGTPVVIRP